MAEQISSRLCRTLESHPFRSLLVCGVLALPLTLGLAAWWAGAWERGYVDESVVQANERLKERTERIAEKAAARFVTIKQLAALLASELAVDGHGLKMGVARRVSGHLAEIAARLRLHRVLLIDTRGVCVASNDAGSPVNLVGVNLADREYVQQALKGNSSTEFVVGRVSTVPGFHFSAPVVRGGKVIGVLALKADLRSLAHYINLSGGFITDSLGVVVIAENQEHLLTATPGSSALVLDVAECRRRYQRDRLKELPLTPVRMGRHVAYLYGDGDGPQLMQAVKLPSEDLNIYCFDEMGGILANAELGASLRLRAVGIVLYLAMMLVCSSVVYVLRDRRQMRALSTLNEELRDLAHRDPLTRCFNRRSFDEMLQQEVWQSERNGQPFSLALFDLDWFKSVNDTYGHGVGDEVLQRVAEAMRGELRAGDMLARMGGDEFAVLLPGASEGGAVEIMSRVVRQLAAEPVAEPGHVQTLSVGVAAWRSGQTPEQLCAEADKALYEAKRQGRGRVVGRAQMAE
jgi:diguanylate cyclase (GGDEF)-like protein